MQKLHSFDIIKLLIYLYNNTQKLELLMNNNFDQYRLAMINLLNEKYKQVGFIQSEVPNLDFYFSEVITEQISVMYEPSICIILQGSKEVVFGDNIYNYNEKNYLVASTHLPAKIKILEASAKKPYMSLRIKFRLEEIYEVLKKINSSHLQTKTPTQEALFFDTMNFELYDSLFRLIKLLHKSRDDISFLYPLLLEEILYNLIKSNAGYFISQFSTNGTVSNQMVKVITQIKENFNEKLRVKELAHSINMSESSLYQHFKIITHMSPIQFQKKIRLEEAKQLLLLRNMEINEIAFAVGYESPSQFSREYSRMFGMSPKAHGEYLKTLH